MTEGEEELQNAIDYKIVNQNKKVIKKDIFRFKKKPYIIGLKNGGEEEEVDIQVIKEGDAVTSMIVTCSCGKVINIECQ